MITRLHLSVKKLPINAFALIWASGLGAATASESDDVGAGVRGGEGGELRHGGKS